MDPDLARESLADEGAVTLEDVLEPRKEFGTASRALLAWEFTLDGTEPPVVWDQAVGEGLLRSDEEFGGTGGQMYVRVGPGFSPVRASAHRRSSA